MSIRKIISDWFMASWWFVPPAQQPTYEPPKRQVMTVKHHARPRCPTGPARGVYIQR